MKNKLVLLLPLAALLGACSTIRTTVPSAPSPVAKSERLIQKESGFSPQQAKWIEKNCPFGAPQLEPSWDFGSTDYIVREGYALQHSATDKIAIWVSEGVTGIQLTGNAKRRDRFKADPDLQPGRRAEVVDYVHSGFDMGHQAPAADQQNSQELNDQTFYLSNMAPQVGGMNRNIWKSLEGKCRDWAEGKDVTYIITGGLFYDPSDSHPKSVYGAAKHGEIGKDHVAVPTHFYKILVWKDSSSKWQAVAFVMENKAYKSPYKFEDFVYPIDWVEARTGIDFMPELPALEERRLEHNKGKLPGQPDA